MSSMGLDSRSGVFPAYEHQLLSQGFPSDVISIAIDGLGEFVGGLVSNPDPIRVVQIGVLAGRLDPMDDLPGPALGDEIISELGIEGDQEESCRPEWPSPGAR